MRGDFIALSADLNLSLMGCSSPYLESKMREKIHQKPLAFTTRWVNLFVIVKNTNSLIALNAKKYELKRGLGRH